MKRFLLAALASFTVVGAPAFAASYPDKVVQLVVGYPPGGASDIVARLLTKELETLNSQPFIVENKPGVGGMLGLKIVADSPPDGYVLGLGVSGTLVTGPHLRAEPMYDPKSDFAPVSMVVKVPMVLLAGPSLKQNSVSELIAEAKARPDELFFASGAQAFELALQLFNSRADVKIPSVTYKGGAAASMDVMGGRVPLMVDSIGAQKANIESGKLRALAVLDNTRSPVLPDVPTMKEAGVVNYEAVGWIAVVAPKGTPDAIVDKLSEQIQQIVALPEFQEKVISLGFEPAGSSAQELKEIINTEYDKWGEVVKASGMKPN